MMGAGFFTYRAGSARSHHLPVEEVALWRCA